jgi:dimethylargininase
VPQIVAITRSVSPSIVHCELTHLAREPIDLARAAAQHARYEAALAALGCTVERLPDAPDLPDAVFVEDAAVVLDRIAVVTRPGAASRRPETASVAAALARYRALRAIEAPGTLDGGDVLRVGTRLFVGRTGRSNAAGIAQLARFAAEDGLTVVPVEVSGCLHLKSAVTEFAPGRLLVQPEWLDLAPFAGLDRLPVDPAEPSAANVLRVGPGLLVAAAYPRTRARLEAEGIAVQVVDASELAKAEGALTCCSLIVTPSA